MLEFRDLTAEDIECRVQSTKENGLILLLYKDARCDMRILDETVGPENWQREHYECKGNLFCRVGIDVNAIVAPTCPKWIWKSDCGTESNQDAEKGEASDSFKRACFNWGIGRELYTSPFIWVSVDNCKIKEKSQGGKPTYVCNDKFEATKITVENKQITELEIYNATQKCDVFSWKKKGQQKKAEPKKKSEAAKPEQPRTAEESILSDEQIACLIDIGAQAGFNYDQITARSKIKYGKVILRDLTEDEYNETLAALKKSAK